MPEIHEEIYNMAEKHKHSIDNSMISYYNTNSMISDFLLGRRIFLEKQDKLEQFEVFRRKIDEEYGSLLDSFGLSKARMKIICTICEKGRPCSQKEVCDDWYENKQTINSAAKKLEEEGYIDIAPSPENFREKLLVLTEKGKFFARGSVKKMLAADRIAFSKFTEEEQETAIRLNEKFYYNLKEEFEKIKGESE